MTIITRIIRWLWSSTPLFIFYVLIILTIYIIQNNISVLPDKFTMFVGTLLTFVAVFYTVIVITDFMSKLKDLNTDDTLRLKNEIEKLNRNELLNFENEKYRISKDNCSNKIEVYDALRGIRNRQVNNFLLFATLALITTLIIDIFIPQKFTVYRVIPAIWGSSIGLYFVLRIIFLFYKVYSASGK